MSFDDWKLTLPRRFHSIISQRAPRAVSTGTSGSPGVSEPRLEPEID